MPPPAGEAARVADLAHAGVFVLRIVAAGLAIPVVARITALQSEREQALRGPVFGAPMHAFTPHDHGFLTAP
ncbi:hypothetical protein [Embleya sp. NPDC005575]|uniref:hypothetical protein n=1 Tax=Embleya sp. NPDC005575 TaxID=3156892 RepID=UPI0033B5F786